MLLVKSIEYIYNRKNKTMTKQEIETLENAALNLYPNNPYWVGDGKNRRLYDEFAKSRQGFIQGAKWQAKRMYSEEEVYNILLKHTESLFSGEKIALDTWFEQFKKQTEL